MTTVLELALQEGMKVNVCGDRVYITFDTQETSKDLWKAQIQFWTTGDKILESGFIRLENNNKISLSKSKK